MDNAMENVRATLCQPKLRALYANTFYSLAGRLDGSGYLEESFVPVPPTCFCATVLHSNLESC